MNLPEVPEDLQQLAFCVNREGSPLAIAYWLRDGHSIDDIRDALRLTVEGGKRSLRYTRAILESWAKEGRETKEAKRYGYIERTDRTQDSSDV